MKKILLGLSVLIIGVGTTVAYAKEKPVVRSGSGSNYMMNMENGHMRNSNMNQDMRNYMNSNVNRNMNNTNQVDNTKPASRSDNNISRDSNYNNSYTEKEMKEMFESRVKYRRAELKELLDKGLISQEEYDYELKDISQVEKYHEESGYDYMGRYGHCELGSGMGIRSSGSYGMGMGRGMGRGCHR